MSEAVQNLSQLAEQLDGLIGLKAAWEPVPQRTVSGGFTSDLLSDVIANCPEDALFITIQAHKNTVAAASLAGAAGIVICSNRPLPDDMVAAARDEAVALFITERDQFQTSCAVGQLLQKGR